MDCKPSNSTLPKSLNAQTKTLIVFTKEDWALGFFQAGEQITPLTLECPHFWVAYPPDDPNFKGQYQIKFSNDSSLVEKITKNPSMLDKFTGALSNMFFGPDTTSTDRQIKPSKWSSTPCCLEKIGILTSEHTQKYFDTLFHKLTSETFGHYVQCLYALPTSTKFLNARFDDYYMSPLQYLFVLVWREHLGIKTNYSNIPSSKLLFELCLDHMPDLAPWQDSTRTFFKSLLSVSSQFSLAWVRAFCTDQAEKAQLYRLATYKTIYSYKATEEEFRHHIINSELLGCLTSIPTKKHLFSKVLESVPSIGLMIETLEALPKDSLKDDLEVPTSTQLQLFLKTPINQWARATHPDWFETFSAGIREALKTQMGDPTVEYSDEWATILYQINEPLLVEKLLTIGVNSKNPKLFPLLKSFHKGLPDQQLVRYISSSVEISFNSFSNPKIKKTYEMLVDTLAILENRSDLKNNVLQAVEKLNMLPLETHALEASELELSDDLFEHYLGILKQSTSYHQKNDGRVNTLKIFTPNSQVSNSIIEKYILWLLDLYPQPTSQKSCESLMADIWWQCLWRLEGKVSEIRAHPRMIFFQNVTTQYITAILKGEKFVNEMNTFLSSTTLQSFKRWAQDLNIRSFEQVENALQSHKEKIQALATSVNQTQNFIRFGEQFSISGVETLSSHLDSKKNEVMSVYLKDIPHPDLWEWNTPLIINLASKIQNVCSLQTFATFRSSKPMDKKLTLENCESFVTEFLEEFQHHASLFCAEPKIFDQVPATQVEALWKKIEESEIEPQMKALSEYIGKSFNPQVLHKLRNYSQLGQTIERAESLQSFVSLFPTPSLKSFNTPENIETATLSEISTWVDGFKSTEKWIDSWDLVMELGRSKTLVGFLKETQTEDFRNLIDAVEQHSDQFVSVKTVSDFLDARSFILPLFNCENILQKIKGCEMITPKLVTCNENINGIKHLFSNVANRGEVTKEIIASCINNGSFEISLHELECDVAMSYSVGKVKRTYSLEELQDLRSRALLLTSEGYGAQSDMQLFIGAVEMIQTLRVIFISLLELGRPMEEKAFSMRTKKEMEGFRDEYEEILEDWKQILEENRKKFYFINYVPSTQFECLHRLFSNTATPRDEDRAFDIFRSIVPNFEKDWYHEYDEAVANYPPNAEMEEIPTLVATALDKMVRPMMSKKSSIPETMPITGPITDLVPWNKPVVFDVKDQSKIVNLLLSIYSHTARFPHPLQVVFCSETTSWETLQLALYRCFYAHRNGFKAYSLTCFVHIENLDLEHQYRFVSEVRELSLKSENEKFALALIGSGNRFHHIRDQFDSNVEESHGMKDADVKETLSKLGQTICCFSSPVSGCGKTEMIKQQAAKHKKSVVSFPISGQFEKDKVLIRLKALKLRSFTALHLDLSSVEEGLRSRFNDFLFQLIVLRLIQSQSDIFALPRGLQVFIEIGNTLNSDLLKNLPLLNFFPHTLVVGGSQNLIVSQDTRSPIQLVCKYFDLYETKKLDSVEVVLDPNGSPLSADKCRTLMKKHFFSAFPEASYSTMDIFLHTMAFQLRAFSSSAFFKVNSLQLMLGNQKNIRTLLFDAILKMALEFATRSVRERQNQEVASKPISSVERLEGMLKFEDTNHLAVMISNSGSLSVVYRDVSLVPNSISDLMKAQKGKNWVLDNYRKMSANELLDKLKSLVHQPKKELPAYALTPDNLLKMMLILIRIQADMPIIIMGATGCGKTSLIRYLASFVGAALDVLNFHAGITEERIIQFISEVEAKSYSSIRWVFLDEINTCDHLGLLSEVICHHQLQGKKLHKNLKFIAVCNPYMKRPKRAQTAGLEGKVQWDEKSDLVYQVHPLPERMLDYVWDYGALNPIDERSYIAIISEAIPAKKLRPLVVELLARSQSFVRSKQYEWSVSLRDIKRFIHLLNFFIKQNPYHPEPAVHYALAHCYLSRFSSSELRNEYLSMISSVYKDSKIDLSAPQLRASIEKKQKEYLDSMTLPEGTAKNEALTENVFVTLVCILNRIPIFIEGKPGCSKSLTLQLINSNVRGGDSKGDFKKLPQVYFIAYQGSESSTSDGILKVFQKAEQYLEHNKDNANGVIPVVVLDEVGLAEISKHKPLKVLHSLLEPAYPQEYPNVAVVGISNWALDAAKMNRAIHLCRTEPTVEDLLKTAKAIQSTATQHNDLFLDQKLHAVVSAYYAYEKKQKQKNFHGLRDFYSLSKCFRNSNLTNEMLLFGLERNFGGLPGSVEEIRQKFIENGIQESFQISEKTPSIKLIQANLNDPLSRHLMLISDGNLGFNVIQEELKKMKRKSSFILGSHFPGDRTEEFDYRVLSEIILCMENGIVLILKDLQSVYGSLYDMLNQNYLIIGKKKNCRIALGAYSNPICAVHENFRCVVLLTKSEVRTADPPFLNRFEKQGLSYEELLSAECKGVVDELQRWVAKLSTCKSKGSTFSAHDMFPGFSEDTIPSLVLFHSHSPQDILEKCKETIIGMATFDSIHRLGRADIQFDEDEIERVKQIYSKQVHSDLYKFILSTQNQDHDGVTKVMLHTFSNINCELSSILQSIDYQAEKLGSFETELELVRFLNKFFKSEKDVLIFQCDIRTDLQCLGQVKAKIDAQTLESNSQAKIVIVMIHIDRQSSRTQDLDDSLSAKQVLSLNFMSDWKMVVVDNIETPLISVKEYASMNLRDALTISRPFKEILDLVATWSLLTINYSGSQNSVDRFRFIIKNLSSNPQLSKSFEEKILSYLEGKLQPEWFLDLLCDKSQLIQNLTVERCINSYLEQQVRAPLAMILFDLEKNSALMTFFSLEEGSREYELWLTFFSEVIDIEQILFPSKLNFYSLTPRPDMLFPFSSLILEKIESFSSLFDERSQESFESLALKLRDTMSYEPLSQSISLGDITGEHCFDNYLKDFIHSQLRIYEPNSELDSILVWIFTKYMEQLYPEGSQHPFIDLHMLWWKQKQQIQPQVNLLLACLHCLPLSDLQEALQSLESYSASDLLSHICQRILLSRKVVKMCGGDEKWQTMVYKVISSAAKINTKLPILHELRFCNDLLNMMKGKQITENILYQLTTLASKNKLFEEATCAEALPQALKLDASVSLPLFKRLSDAFPKNEELRKVILQYILAHQSKENELSISALLVRLIRNTDPELFEEFFESSSSFDVFNSPKTTDTPLACLLCDKMKEQIYSTFIDNEALGEDCDELLDMLPSAFTILKESDSRHIQTISAVAFLRQLFECFAEAVTQEFPIAEPLVEMINEHFASLCDRFLPIKIYALKALKSQTSLQETKKLSQSLSAQFPWLKSLKWEDSIGLEIGFNFFHHPEYHKAEMQVLGQLERNSSLLNSPTDSVLAAVANQMFFQPVQTSNMGETANWFESKGYLGAKGFRKELFSMLIRKQPFLFEPKTIEEKCIASVMIHLMLGHNEAKMPWAYLNKYSLQNSYVVGGPSDETASVFRTLVEKGQFTRYRCSCGFIYVVENCGAFNQSSTCPECKRQIGAASHGVDGHSQRLDASPVVSKEGFTPDKKGFIYVNPQTLTLQHTERGLRPATFRMIHMLVHCVLLCDPKVIMTQQINSPKAYLLDHIKNDWNALKTLLGVTCEDLTKIFHIVLKSITWPSTSSSSEAATRLEWEHRFQQMVAPILEQLSAQLQSFNKEEIPSQSILESEICETLSHFSEIYVLNNLPNLFRIAPPRDSQSLATSLSTHSPKDFPFLQFFFEQLDKIELVCHLGPLIRWSNFVSKNLGQKLKREEARTKKVANILDDYEQEGAPNQTENQFEEFAVAWKAVAPYIKGWECKEFKVPMQEIKMQKSTPIGYSCIDTRDMGLYLRAAIVFLAGIQNSILDQALHLAAQGKKSFRYFVQEAGLSALKEVDVQAIGLQEIIKLDPNWLSRVVVDYGYSSCQYGNGKKVFFDLDQMEIELVNQTMVGRSFLNFEKFQSFQFLFETFHANIDILDLVQKKIPQEAPSASAIEHVSSFTTDVASSVLGALNVALCFILKTGGKPNRPLTEYCEEWVDSKIQNALKPCKGLPLELRHINHLYGAIEILLADSMLSQSLDPAYRKELSHSARDEIQQAISKFGSDVLLKVLKQFMFRFLMIDSYTPSAPLFSFLSSVWNSQELEMGDLFPEIKLEHALEFLKLIQSMEDQKELLSKKPIVPKEKKAPDANKKARRARTQVDFGSM